jgi:hypothetical protein
MSLLLVVEVTHLHPLSSQLPGFQYNSPLVDTLHPLPVQLMVWLGHKQSPSLSIDAPLPASHTKRVALGGVLLLVPLWMAASLLLSPEEGGDREVLFTCAVAVDSDDERVVVTADVDAIEAVGVGVVIWAVETDAAVPLVVEV